MLSRFQNKLSYRLRSKLRLLESKLAQPGITPEKRAALWNDYQTLQHEEGSLLLSGSDRALKSPPQKQEITPVMVKPKTEGAHGIDFDLLSSKERWAVAQIYQVRRIFKEKLHRYQAPIHARRRKKLRKKIRALELELQPFALLCTERRIKPLADATSQIGQSEHGEQSPT